MSSSFAQQVYAVTRRIPRGQVATYAQVAAAIGHPRAVRAVGNALRKNPTPGPIPCHRVIRSDGSIGGYIFGYRAKWALLRAEGVTVSRQGRALDAVQFTPKYRAEVERRSP